MKRIDDLEQSIRELPVQVDPAMDERILGRATAAMTQAPGAPAGKPSTTNKGHLLMNRGWTRLAAVAAALIAAVVVYDALLPVNRPAGTAFGDVLLSAARARTVTYKQVQRMPGSPDYPSEEMLMEPGHCRYHVSAWYVKDSITIVDHNRGVSLMLVASEKKAHLQQAVNLPDEDRLGNYFDDLRGMHRDSGRLVRQEMLDGKPTNVYVVDKPFKKTTIWTDPATNLAVRMETHVWPNPKCSGEAPTIAIDHMYFGGEHGVGTPVRASDPGIQGEMTTIRSDFVWDAELDPSLFDVTPPPDYKVDQRQYDASEATENHLVAALRFWAEGFEGAFPASIRTLLEAEAMMAKRFRADPDRLNQALRMAGTIVDGVLFAEKRKVQDNFHYAGQGVKIGQADKPVCWWGIADGKTCRVIYGDLAIRDVPAERLNGVPESPEVKPVVHTVRYKQMCILDGNTEGAARSTEMLMEPGYQRTDGFGSVGIMDFGIDIDLQLLTREKVAYLRDYDRPPSAASQPITNVAARVRRASCYNPLRALAMVYLRGTPKRQEALDGRTVEVYEYNSPSEKEHGTVWLDPSTELPVRIEKVKMIEERQPKTGDQREAGDAADSRPALRELKYVLTDFEWDVPLDPELFSVEVPEGYTVKYE